jgi:hypothetical protein
MLQLKVCSAVSKELPSKASFENPNLNAALRHPLNHLIHSTAIPFKSTCS